MDNRANKEQFDVIVIGGGATGAGTARDCAMRGLRVLSTRMVQPVVTMGCCTVAPGMR